MRSYPKPQKTIKWGGAAITLLLIVLWAMSLRWQVMWISRGNPVVMTGLVAGVVAYIQIEMPPGGHIRTQPSWTLRHAAMTPEWELKYERSTGLFSILVLILVPAAFALAASLVACRLDVIARRRAQPNLCHKCGYNLSGLPSVAACPECGNQRSARVSR